MDQFYEEFKVVLNEAFRITVSRDQLVFIDNQYADQELLDQGIFSQGEIQRFNTQLSNLQRKTQKQEPFACLNIQAVMRDKDELMEQIKKK